MKKISHKLLVAMPLALLVICPMQAIRKRTAASDMEEPIKIKAHSNHHVPEIKKAEHYHSALKGDKDIVVDVFADWCEACKMFKPAYNQVAGEHKDHALFFILNFDNPELQKIVNEFRNHYREQEGSEIGLPFRVYIRNGKIHRIKTGAKEADAFHREVSNVLGLPSERKAPMPTPSKKPRAKTTDEYSPAKRQKFSSEDLDEEAKKRKIDELTRLGEREYKKLQANGKNR